MRETSAGATGVMLLEVLTMMAACVEDEPSHYTRIVAGRRRLGEAGDAFAKPALIPARGPLMHSSTAGNACA
ncbi:hypothetical protein [Burkholderia gladioli]|uniref:hypothetical protein n=1 Tax=Burkholderia gladioli TaxID=28095 RepID=UPI0016409169|nr:hypothetical protein [Burkholderia gladioli]